MRTTKERKEARQARQPASREEYDEYKQRVAAIDAHAHKIARMPDTETGSIADDLHLPAFKPFLEF